MKKPRVLVIDIEVSPLVASVWKLWDNDVPLNMLERDWFIIAFAAKFLGDPPNKMFYMDQRKEKNVEDDSKILKAIWKLLDMSDIVLTQNGRRFDVKKINARFIQNGMLPPSPFKQIDTLVLAKKHFAFTSNKLEYLTDKLCTKYKKLTHHKFSGFTLWKECLIGNQLAWKEMEKYNKYDVLSLEELYGKLQAWDSTINFNLYHDELSFKCNCGSDSFQKRGYAYTNTGRFQQWRCNSCGAWTRSTVNLLTKEKRASLRRK